MPGWPVIGLWFAVLGALAVMVVRAVRPGGVGWVLAILSTPVFFLAFVKLLARDTRPVAGLTGDASAQGEVAWTEMVSALGLGFLAAVLFAGLCRWILGLLKGPDP